MENIEFLSSVEVEKEVKNLTEKKEVKAIRSRTFNIMQYEIFLTEEKIKAVVSSYKTIKRYAYIKHDKDVGDDGVIKKPHFHIVLQFEQLMPNTTIAKWLGIAPNFVDVPKGRDSFIQCVQYLTHESAAQQKLGKYLYSDDEVIANFNFREDLDNYKNNEVQQIFKGTSKKIKLRLEIRKGFWFPELSEEDYESDKKNILIARQEYINLYAPLPKSRTNYYLSGPSGIGKSLYSRALAKALIDPENLLKDNEVFYEIGDNKVMFQEYQGQPVIIWDDCRGLGLIEAFKTPEKIFKLFDPVPSNRLENKKFGSVRLINTINIVNGIDNFEVFASEICFKNSAKKENDSQIYRRFPFIIDLNNEGEGYDYKINKKFFNPEEPNWKAYLNYAKLQKKVKMLIVLESLPTDSNEYVEFTKKYFELPLKNHSAVGEKFRGKDLNDEDKKIYLTSLLNENLDNEIIEATDYVINNLTDQEKKQMEIDELKTRLRELTGF